MELLAPVGSIRALYAAINSGADAVYLGVDGFNARAKAVGFTTGNIDEYIDLCHLHGVKVYIAFNTAVKEKELTELDRYVRACRRADAFIIADLGALDVFYRYDVPLHASTQMGVNNLEGALFLQSKGFSRVVVARETAREDIITIKKNTNLELEYFVHGALCVSYSGSCLLSSMMSGDSGNRGRCNQPCRLRYSSDLSGKEGYLLSPSEQCLITKLDDLREIGVDSLKIEGRLKQPHYVSTVVDAYRKVLDGARADENRVSDLKKVFNRGEFTCGYIYDDTRGIMSPKVQSNIGVPVGRVIYSDRTRLKIKANQPLRDGDGIKLLFKGEEAGGFGVKIIGEEKNVYTLAARSVYPVGSEVRKTLDSEIADEEINLVKLPIELNFRVNEDMTVSLTASGAGASVSCAAKAEEAKSRPMSASEIGESLARLGETPFSCETVNVDLCGREIFMPRSAVNALKRKAVSKLTSAILNVYEEGRVRCDFSNCKLSTTTRKKSGERRLIVNTDDFSHISALSSENIDISYQIYDYSQFFSQIDIFLGLIQNNSSIYLHLSPVVRGSEIDVVRDILNKCRGNIAGLICENYYTLQLAKEYGFKSVAGIRLNVYNSRFKCVSGADDVILSPELTLSEADDVNDSDAFVYAYGLLPVMTLCHCPVQVSTGCNCRDCAYDGDFYYHDKKADYLIKRIRIKRCTFELFNPAPVDISAKADKIRYNLYINMVNCKRDPLEVIKSVTAGGRPVPGSNCAHLFRGVK